VVEHVVRRVAEQVWDGPFAEWLALRVPIAHRLDEAVAVMGEPAGRAGPPARTSPSRAREVATLVRQDVPNDLVAGGRPVAVRFAETRAAVSSNSAHAARSSRTWRSNVGASNGSQSSGEGTNEMPQKSVEPTPGYRPMMSRLVWVVSCEPSRTRFATGRYRGT
jgi:hypothetical protein